MESLRTRRATCNSRRQGRGKSYKRRVVSLLATGVGLGEYCDVPFSCEEFMLRLRDIMTTEVLTVAPDMSLREAMELFTAHHISGAPVMAGGKVLGVISATDILEFASTASRAAAERASASLADSWLDQDEFDINSEEGSEYLAELWSRQDEPPLSDSMAEGSGGSDPLDANTVADAMTYGIYALPPTAHASAAAENMRAGNVHRLLVMDGDELAGIVTTMDLVRAVADRKLVRRTYVFDRSVGG